MIQELSKFLTGEYGWVGLMFGIILTIFGLVIILVTVWLNKRRRTKKVFPDNNK
jgi:uncharacterized membrane protein